MTQIYLPARLLPLSPLPSTPKRPRIHKPMTHTPAPLLFNTHTHPLAHRRMAIFLHVEVAGPTAAIFSDGHPHLLIAIKFGLIVSFSPLCSPSAPCNSSLSHLSLSLGSSEPLTSDPQAGSPQGQDPGGGRQAHRMGWKVCYWGMPASSFGHGYSLLRCCHSNWARRQSEQTEASCWDGALSSVVWLHAPTRTHKQQRMHTHTYAQETYMPPPPFHTYTHTHTS